LIGTRRAGLDDQDPDLPLADRVDLFVRQRDRAVLEVNYRQAGKVLQHIEVVSLDLDLDLPAKVFVVDGRGQPLRDVKQHQPLWELVEQTLRRADAKAAAGDVRPSQR
jgi:site-specific recombinase XerC